MSWYKELQEQCKDCYLPEKHVVLAKIANTPEYLRRYFKQRGKQ